MSSTNHLPPNWDRRLLQVIGAPVTLESLKLLDAWARAEGGTARWNPLNTTYGLPGSSNYNSVGVKNFRRATEGVCATALTLVNGNYQGIVSSLQAGKLTARQIVAKHAAEFGVWGTGAKNILRLL